MSASPPDRSGAAHRRRLSVAGVVQGVGMRPYVCRLAHELELAGWVRNAMRGIEIEVEGKASSCSEFERRLADVEPPARPAGIESRAVPAEGERHFRVRASRRVGVGALHVAPDLVICKDCLREVRAPQGRRSAYPFTSCARCGPRYTILLGLPYDRARTTLREFALCQACSAEFHDLGNRRFHAQTQACPDCGPRLHLTDARGRTLAQGPEALARATRALNDGQIVASKGVGGFQLLVRALDAAAVGRLRRRKERPHKPLALLYASLEAVLHDCRASACESAWLDSAAGPIVLLERRVSCPVPEVVAPGANPELGVMLPTSGLHALLADAVEGPLVATSGNLAGEPLCTDDVEARARLGRIADLFLGHDRAIARPCDDSVGRVVDDRPLLLRRARGHAPTCFPLERAPRRCILGLGGHLKSTLAFTRGAAVWLGPHIGDLEDARTIASMERALEDLRTLHEVAPEVVAHDAHPDYWTTRRATRSGCEARPVLHHVAHASSLRLEHGLRGPVLAVAWDGAGLGADGTLWGGEFLRVSEQGFERIGALRTFPLPGGECASREPRRAALGALFEAFGPSILDAEDLPPVASFAADERRLLCAALVSGLRTPRTSSVGRLFDAVSALVGAVQRASYEGQAACALEWSARGRSEDPYAWTWRTAAQGHLEIDWVPALAAVVDDVRSGTPRDTIAGRFHAMLIEAIERVALHVGLSRVLLTGGCFQNLHLLRGCIDRLRATGLDPYWHQQVPPGDGGLSLGQVVCVAEELERDVPRRTG